MSLTSPVQPILRPVRIRDLRPTQLTVGMFEVDRKRQEWRGHPRDEAGRFLGAHMIPAVIGPNGHPWIVDHHHLVLALHLEGVDDVMVSVLAHLDRLPKRRFLAFMDAHNWLHPYDAEGKRRDWRELPRRIEKLLDDPYRSLAGMARRAGGYAKSASPYSEFLWADFFRDRIKGKMIETQLDKALDRAVRLARSSAARHLPGWSGVDSE